MPRRADQDILEYATPTEVHRRYSMILVLRRLAFASGLGLFGAGLGSALMALGLFLVGLFIPLGKL